MESPTARSLSYLKKQGYIAQVVERWNPYAKVRIDLFGFIDIVAIDPLREGHCSYTGVTGVQTTSTGNMSKRIAKILGIPEAKVWLECGNRIIVQGWSKKGKAGTRKLWTLKETEITLADFRQ